MIFCWCNDFLWIYHPKYSLTNVFEGWACDNRPEKKNHDENLFSEGISSRKSLITSLFTWVENLQWAFLRLFHSISLPCCLTKENYIRATEASNSTWTLVLFNKKCIMKLLNNVWTSSSKDIFILMWKQRWEDWGRMGKVILLKFMKFTISRRKLHNNEISSSRQREEISWKFLKFKLCHKLFDWVARILDISSSSNALQFIKDSVMV